MNQPERTHDAPAPSDLTAQRNRVLRQALLLLCLAFVVSAAAALLLLGASTARTAAGAALAVVAAAVAVTALVRFHRFQSSPSMW